MKIKYYVRKDAEVSFLYRIINDNLEVLDTPLYVWREAHTNGILEQIELKNYAKIHGNRYHRINCKKEVDKLLKSEFYKEILNT